MDWMLNTPERIYYDAWVELRRLSNIPGAKMELIRIRGTSWEIVGLPFTVLPLGKGNNEMVNYIRLMEDVSKKFREEFGQLANPRDHPEALQRIIENCTDMLEEEANNHNDIGENDGEN